MVITIIIVSYTNITKTFQKTKSFLFHFIFAKRFKKKFHKKYEKTFLIYSEPESCSVVRILFESNKIESGDANHVGRAVLLTNIKRKATSFKVAFQGENSFALWNEDYISSFSSRSLARVSRYGSRVPSSSQKSLKSSSNLSIKSHNWE